MPITIGSTNAPNLLVVNETTTGFYLATLAVSGVQTLPHNYEYNRCSW